MSRAFTGGSEVYESGHIAAKHGVLKLIEQFIRDNFRAGNDVASEVVRDKSKRIMFLADDDEQTSPATLGQREDNLVAYGAVSYLAKDHSVQTIWENQFEVREQNNERVYVRFSNWHGTTVQTWNKKVRQRELYV